MTDSMDAPVGHPYALWLLPAEEQRERLESLIRALAGRHGTPAFGPHATLCSGVLRDLHAELPALRERLNRLCAAIHPFSFRVTGTGQAEDYFTFLFLWLSEENGQEVFRRASAEAPGAQLPQVGPHLSLMYCDRFREVDRTSIVREVSADLPETVRIDRIQIVTPGSGGWRDVQSWKVWETRRLED